jgi:RNA polymerase sigma-70 factor, ECF subfamily
MDGARMARTGTKSGLLEGGQTALARTGTQFRVLADYDTQLMLLVRDGDPVAANALARRNIQRVAAYIGRLVRDRHAAEELTHDVFVHVLENASRYRPSAKFSTWLYRIATNTAMNYLKRASIKRRRSPPPDAEAPVFVDCADRSPERRMVRRELCAQVADALESLPVNQRIAVILFECEDLPYKQIAAVLDTTEDAVRCLLRRARDTLGNELAGLK